MKSFAIFALSLLAVFFRANAWCVPWSKAGSINLCKGRGKTDCVSKEDDNSCGHLGGEYYVSGFTNGAYDCTIFRNFRCRVTWGDDIIRVNNFGRNFPFEPVSFRCPCVPR